MFNKLQSFLEKTLQPFAIKMSQNPVVQSITNGMMGIISLTVGVCLVSILVNLPFEPWITFLTNIKILGTAKELISATSSMLALYVVVSISYSYAKTLKQDTRACVITSLAVFVTLMPQTVTVGEQSVSALLSSNLGSNGMFLALIIGLVVTGIYNFLITHNVKINMPEQVPPNVCNAMTPIIACMIIFTGTLFVKWGFALTQFGDIYTFFKDILMAPLMAVLGTSIITPILYCVLRALFWFFGIHPSPINAVYLPISAAVTTANIEAMQAGSPIPYILFAITTAFGMMGGTGSTLSLNILMLKAKSERYKALNKVAFVPGLFNINEPLVFGVPVMYNPIMLIPTILAPLSGAFIAWLSVATGFINGNNFNPAVSVAWVIPSPIAAFLRGGICFFIAIVVAIVVQCAIFYPFFKMLDDQAYAEEQAENTKA